MNIKEDKAKELLERILKDLNRKLGANLVVVHRTKNYQLCNGRLVDSMFIAEMKPSDYGPKFIPMLMIHGDGITYLKLLNRLAKDGMENPNDPFEAVDILKDYGSTYEQMMMVLDMNDVE